MNPLTYRTDARAASFFARFDSRRLNLGSSTEARDGYVNVGMHGQGASDTLVGNVVDLPDLPSCNFDEIAAQDVIDHIPPHDVPLALLEWNRLLAIGGTLHLRGTWALPIVFAVVQK